MGPISPAQYHRICLNRQKNRNDFKLKYFLCQYRWICKNRRFFSRFLSQITFERHERRHFRIKSQKFGIFNFYLIAFGRVFKLTHFGDLLHTNLLRTSSKIRKIIRHMTAFLLCVFFHFLNKFFFYFCSSNVSISPKFFGKKLRRCSLLLCIMFKWCYGNFFVVKLSWLTFLVQSVKKTLFYSQLYNWNYTDFAKIHFVL